jgi:hypothetical protein
MKKILMVILMVWIASCSGKGATGSAMVSLSLRTAQSFNSTVVHGEITRYRVTVTGGNLSAPLVKYFDKTAKEARFDGFPLGTDVYVIVEYLNVNGVVVRRGRSEAVHIQKGNTTPVEITVNNVPIFANVKDGAIVANDRFVPKVFAPGGIPFQITDNFNGSANVMSDDTNALTTLSVSADESTSVMPFHVSLLTTGTHELSVKDPVTGESTTVKVIMVESDRKKALATTAGGNVGSLMSKDKASGLSLVDFQQKKVKADLDLGIVEF